MDYELTIRLGAEHYENYEAFKTCIKLGIEINYEEDNQI
jgi:hypothetical protein